MACISRAHVARFIVTAAITVPVFARAAQGSAWTAPAAAADRLNPLANRADTVAGGRKLFAQRCATCHGDDGRGTRKGPNLASGFVQRQSDGALFWKITQGNTRTGMLTFSFLPVLQRWQLALYLRQLGTIRP